MASEKRGGSQTSGFLFLLALLFIGLRLTGHIDWSWWWVTAPLWAPSVLVGCVLVVWLVFAVLNELRKAQAK